MASTRVRERLCACVYGEFFGLLLNYTCLLRVAGSAAAFRQKVDSINNYMKYRDISVHLQEKIHRYYRYLWQSRMGIDESEVGRWRRGRMISRLSGCFRYLS